MEIYKCICSAKRTEKVVALVVLSAKKLGIDLKV